MRSYKPSIGIIFILLTIMALLLTACGYLEVAPARPTTTPPTTVESGFKGTVLIGGIFDLSGASAVEGREYSAGALAYTSLFNSRGGANGYKVDLKVADFSAKAPLAIEEYQRLLKEGAIAFLAWDTADTLALTRQLKTDRVPLLSASYDEELVRDVKQQPYNFMIVPSYSDQIKLALLYAKRNRPEWARGEQTRIGFLYSDDSFGRFPQQTGRDYSSSHNITWFHEGVLLPKIDQNNLLFEANRLKTARPEYAFIQAQPALTAEMLKVMQSLELSTLFLGLNYTGAVDLPQLAGKAAEGFMVTAVMAYPDEPEPGLVEIQQWLTEHPGTGPSPTTDNSLTPRFVQGWVTMKVLAEGVRQAVLASPTASGQPLQLNGDKVKEGLESLRQFDTGGITPPLSFSPTNHKGTDSVRILKIENSKWKPITPYLSLANLEYEDSLPTPTPVISTTIPVRIPTSTSVPVRIPASTTIPVRIPTSTSVPVRTSTISTSVPVRSPTLLPSPRR